MLPHFKVGGTAIYDLVRLQEKEMRFKEISSMVGSVPFISKDNGRFLYDLILKERLTNILELGIAHGTATCYMAAALQELGECQLAAIERRVGSQRRHAVDMIVSAGQDRGTARRADRVCAEAVVETHAVFGYPVKVWCLIDAAAVAAHGV